MRRTLWFALIALSVMLISGATAPAHSADPRMKGAYRKPPQDGWTYVHLEGAPAEVGYQHGYLLAAEILDLKNVFALELEHDTHHDWAFFRNAAQTMLWPHIEQEYRIELQGIADGYNAGIASPGNPEIKKAAARLDVWDITAMNAYLEWGYYTAMYDKQHKSKTKPAAVGEHCSAFVATGSYTKDGKVVIAHNNWTSYLDGARWTIAFDIAPAKGHRFVMDGLAGLIHSADDFGLNDAGIVITETTISNFAGYDVNGVPEFTRARKAMQYGTSIDEVAKIFKDGNNGGYANDWLIADTKKNEIASLELGLKNVTLERKTDGYFVGSNFPINPKLAKEETSFNVNDKKVSANARHIRWDQLMAENKGKITVASAQKFLGDHVDTVTGKTEPSERTLCGHIELSSRGSGRWIPPYGAGGAVQNKATDTAMTQKMSFTAAAGHACGIDFIAEKYLKDHPQFAWQKPAVIDMKARPWTTIKAE